jgi:glycosyltransferase involved in cell wall biosynthesis
MPDETRSILYVGPAEGGVARVADGAARALSARGWNVRRVDLGNGRSPLREARRALRLEHAEFCERTVVHVEHGSNDLAAFWFAVLASRLRRDIVTVVHDAPLVVHSPGAGVIRRGTRSRDILAHRLLAPLADGMLRRAYARRIGVALVTSERARSSWVSDRPRHTLCLPISYDAPAAVCTPSQGRHVLFAGYIGPSKGLDVLLDAWAHVGEQSGLPLVIAGGASGALGTAYLAEMRERAQSAASRPQWLGELCDEAFARAFADAAIVVVPYRRSNPASAIVLSAMAMGRAIVGADVPGVADYVTDDLEALIVPVDDVDGLAAGLKALLCDPALRDRLGAAAAARYDREHNWADHCAALEDAYTLAATDAPRAGVS